MSVSDVLAALVIVVALPLNWVVALRLWLLQRQARKVKVLRERTVQAVSLAVIVSVFALVFANNVWVVPPWLDAEATKLLTRGALLVLSTVPALYWLALYWKAGR